MLILYLIFILILILWGIKFKDNDDYISKERCNSIKGIFILLIILTHSMQYIGKSGYEFEGIDRTVSMFRNVIGQMVVVMFLFYSGYGVSLSVKKKGNSYVKSIPRRRLLSTLLNFDVAVMAYVVLNLLISKPMTVSQVGLSLLAWDSVGNSNWYIFVILICYAASYLVAITPIKKNNWVWTFILLVICIFVLTPFKTPFWYNTILAYPAGSFFAEHQERIIPLLRKYYWLLLAGFTSIFVVSYYFLPGVNGFSTNLASICFAFVIVMLSMKIVVGNAFLEWCGSHLFPLFIYQRIPMIVMYECLGTGFVKDNALLFVLIALVTTCIISHFYKYWSFSFK